MPLRSVHKNLGNKGSERKFNAENAKDLRKMPRLYEPKSGQGRRKAGMVEAVDVSETSISSPSSPHSDDFYYR